MLEKTKHFLPTQVIITVSWGDIKLLSVELDTELV